MPDWRKFELSLGRAAPIRRHVDGLTASTLGAAEIWTRLVKRSIPSAVPDELDQLELAPLTRPDDEPNSSTRPASPRQQQQQRRRAGKMKFAHSLLFNAVPDWTNHYLA